MAEPKTMRNVKSLSRLPPPIGLRSENSRALQLHRLDFERRRLVREIELARQRERAVETRLRDVDAQIADLEARLISHPIRTSIEPPISAGAARQHLTVEY